MDKKEIISAIKLARTASGQRKFSQSFDLIMNLKNLDLKKAVNQMDDYVELHHTKGKKIKICALVGSELEEDAKKVYDRTIRNDEFKKLDKKAVKKIAKEYDYFVAQANIMPLVAGTFGRSLGPRGKMPNPKAGCIVPPKGNIGAIYERLQKMVKLTTKKGGSVKTLIGMETMDDEKIADNILVAYNHFLHILPGAENNIKSVMIKTTMGKPIKIGNKTSKSEKEETSKKKTKVNKKPVVPKSEVKKPIVAEDNVTKESDVKEVQK